MKKHLQLSHEVIDKSTKAKNIAHAQSHQLKYKYKARAILTGDPKLRPYDPIYLEGLTDNMSGIWVVLSITHIMNLGLPYIMKVLIGTTDELLKRGKPKDVPKIVPIKIPPVTENDTFISLPFENDYYYYELKETLPIEVPDNTQDLSSIAFPEKSMDIENPVRKFMGDMCCSCHDGLYNLYTPFLPKTDEYIWKDRVV